MRVAKRRFSNATDDSRKDELSVPPRRCTRDIRRTVYARTSSDVRRISSSVYETFVECSCAFLTYFGDMVNI